MELTAKQIYNAVDDWYKTKLNERGCVAPFISVSALHDGLTAYAHLLGTADAGRIKRAADSLHPLLRKYDDPSMTVDVDVYLRHMPAFKMEVFGKYYGIGKREDTLRSILTQINASSLVERELFDDNNWTPAAPLPDISALCMHGATLVDVINELLRRDDIYGSLTAAINDPKITRWHVKSVTMAVAMWLGDTMRFAGTAPRVIDYGTPAQPNFIDYGHMRIDELSVTTEEQAERLARRDLAKLVDYVEPTRTGFVQGGFIPAKQDEATTLQRGFREALHRLVDASAEPDPKVFAYVLLTEFGERLRLSNKVPHFRGVVERDTLAHVDSSGSRAVLWASTGGFIYRSVPSFGRELIDWQHPDNVAHLQACYNAHNTPLGDTHPCSHFTSRPH